MVASRSSSNRAAARAVSLTGIPVVQLESRAVEGEDLARKLLAVSVGRVAVGTIALIALFVLAQLRPPQDHEVESWQYILIGVIYGLTIVYAALLRVRAAVLPLAYAQIALDSLIVSVLVLMTGGIESVFSFAYVFPILGASVLLYRRGAIIAPICTFVMLGGIVVLQLQQAVDVLPPVRLGSALFSFFTNQVGMVLLAVLSGALADKARITVHQLAEKESDLEQLQELHGAILRSLPAGILTLDVAGVIRYANDAALNIVRVPGAEMVGRHLESVVPCMKEAWHRRQRQTQDIVRERFEELYVREDGVRIRIGFSFAPISLASGAGLIVVFQDLTDIVRLKEAVERAERLATVGKFAAGLAHEVRNPLASMCASIDVLQSTLRPPQSVQRLMSNIVNEADRLNSLITDFLAFARPRRVTFCETDLGELASSVLDVFEHDEVMKNCRIERKLTPGVLAFVDADLVRQVIWNLVRNAGEAMRERGGRLTVEVRLEHGGPALAVRDSGPGISPERMQRIFDPFFTTKERGSGLGLAISHSIVEAHGGRLVVESAEGEGTEVVVHFPREADTVDLPLVSGEAPAALLRETSGAEPS